MIKKIYLLPLFLLTLSFIACNETEEPGKYDNWRERNEAFIDSLQLVYDSPNKGNLERVQDPRDKKSYIFFKRMENGDKYDENGDEIKLPLFTSKVTMFYRGMYINEAIFSAAKAPEYFVTKLYAENGIDVFTEIFKGSDPSLEFDSPATFKVNETISGWIEILQLMRPGDRFEVYIPYQCAYGESGKNARGEQVTMGYTTLIYDMRMERIDEY